MSASLISYIPAGGEGTRLLPHTDIEQKPMLPMGSARKKLIDFALEASYACDRIFVSTNSDAKKAEVVESYVAKSPKVLALRDKRAIGAASLLDYFDIFANEDPNGDIAILPADHVHEGLSLRDLQNLHREREADITLLTAPQKNYGDYVNLKGGFACDVINRPSVTSVSITGIYIIANRYLLNWMRTEVKNGWSGQPRSMSRDIIFPAIARDRVAAYRLPNEGYWDDAGTLLRYYENNMRLSRGASVLSDFSRVHPDATIESSVVVGRPQIGRGARIERSIVSGINRKLNISKVAA